MIKERDTLTRVSQRDAGFLAESDEKTLELAAISQVPAGLLGPTFSSFFFFLLFPRNGRRWKLTKKSKGREGAWRASTWRQWKVELTSG